MLISTKGRYALAVMIDLAEHNDGSYIPLKDIAQRQEISEKYLESIIVTFSKGGFLDGVRGKGGGYRLARKPEEYSVGEILRTAEGSLNTVGCLEGDECGKAELCRTHRLWINLDEKINSFLDSITLSEL